MMKQLKTICLSLLLSASLTACAGRAEPKESPANEAGIAEETVKTEEKTETAEEKSKRQMACFELTLFETVI
jgi:ribosomal protein L12E/L44/L45/RPP1/RPP2